MRTRQSEAQNSVAFGFLEFPPILFVAMICLLVNSSTGCSWFGGDSTAADSDNDATVGDAATIDTGVEGESDWQTGTTPTAGSGRRNPQRDLVDPYYILGQPAQQWDVAAWANHESLNMDEPITLDKLRGQVVVVHFWVDGSDASQRTMTALNRLASEFQSEPVVFVGIFLTRESIAENPWEVAQDLANDWKITFPIAADESTLINWWRSRYDHLPNTPTFVIGPEGKIVHLHPGPELFPSDKVADRICDEDYRSLHNAIESALGRQLAETGSNN